MNESFEAAVFISPSMVVSAIHMIDRKESSGEEKILRALGSFTSPTEALGRHQRLRLECCCEGSYDLVTGTALA